MISKCFQKQTHIVSDFVSLFKEDFDNIVNIVIFESLIDINIIFIDIYLIKQTK
jgi:uncharacterized membrane protein YesL